jgi:hypothetical protein
MQGGWGCGGLGGRAGGEDARPPVSACSVRRDVQCWCCKACDGQPSQHCGAHCREKESERFGCGTRGGELVRCRAQTGGWLETPRLIAGTRWQQCLGFWRAAGQSNQGRVKDLAAAPNLRTCLAYLICWPAVRDIRSLHPSLRASADTKDNAWRSAPTDVLDGESKECSPCACGTLGNAGHSQLPLAALGSRGLGRGGGGKLRTPEIRLFPLSLAPVADFHA